MLSFIPQSYPKYCTNDVYTDRAIPPLTEAEQSLVDDLVQLQVIMRHGARTPYELYSCWIGYNVTWNNCNVTELMTTSDSYTSQMFPTKYLYRKIYDGSANYYGGNCMTGQLIYQGFSQETGLGVILKNTYLIGNKTLFASDNWEDIDNSLIYLRSDDQQRTLESGQLTLHSMFNISDEIIIDWHTGDYGLDQIYPNSAVCPRLDVVQGNAYASSEFIAENTSTTVNDLTSTLNNIFGSGYWSWYNVLDCLMTTVCTNREVPDSVTGIGQAMNNEIFNATIAQAELTFAYQLLYNDSQYSKLALGNIAWHIRTSLENAVNREADALKFALFAGHDTTVSLST